jgi:Fe-S oxidoreductase
MAFSEDERDLAMRSCRYCPMCHHVDAVTTVARRETYSPRGRGLTLFAIEKGKNTLTADVADVMYKFTADGLSRQVCAGHINHDEMVIDARRRLVKAGVAPPQVAALKAAVEKSGNPWDEMEPDLAKLTGTKPAKGAETVVYFGPAARIKRPDVVKGLARLLGKAGVAFNFLEKEGGTGLVFYQLGEDAAAHAAANALADKIRKSGAKTVVTPDAEAYRVLAAGFGDFEGLGEGIKVRHAAEVLDELAAGGKLAFKSPGKKIAYHDPCPLARFAPCIEPPRSLLKRIADAAPLELLWNRENAWCSGECGGLPFTNAAISEAVAARRLGQAAQAGAEMVVTASPFAAATLSMVLGNRLPVKDLTELAAECLKG